MVNSEMVFCLAFAAGCTRNINVGAIVSRVRAAIHPSFVSAIADDLGKHPAYIICFATCVLVNSGLGLNDSYAGL